MGKKQPPYLTKEQAAAVKLALGCPGRGKCQHCIETYSDMEGESYRCARCDDSYKLDYEEMR